MPVQNKLSLKSFYKTGFKPTEQNFADLIDSYINLDDDFSGGDLALTNGIQISDSPNAVAGTIRFNTGTSQFEGHDGTSFGPLGGGGGSTPWGVSGPDITFSGGNVGVGTATPQFSLDVDPDQNSNMRLGKAIVGGHPTDDVALFSHHDRDADTEFALSHEANGNLRINISGGSSVMAFSQDGIAQMFLFQGRFGIGGLPVGPEALQVFGDAAKSGGGTWDPISDKRLKKNIKNFKIGLQKLKELNPVSFQYNGKMNLPKDKTHVGLVAQEVKKVMPQMVKAFKNKLNSTDKKDTELFSLDINPLIYMLVNSIKELDKRLGKLESKAS